MKSSFGAECVCQMGQFSSKVYEEFGLKPHGILEMTI